MTEEAARPDGPTGDELAAQAEAEARAETAALFSAEAVRDGRSSRPETCPFLRSEPEPGRLDVPIESPDPSNRCLAFGGPKPQSERQQELVCLGAGHVDCPRYLRGQVFAREVPLARPPRVLLRPAVIGAFAVLIASAAAAFTFVLLRGGISIPTAAPHQSGTAIAAVSPSPGPSPIVTPFVTPDLTPAPTATPVPSPSPSREPSPSPSPSPEPSPSPSPAPTPTPRPSSDRYALLEPCPDRPDCYIYTVRSGDNLSSIAGYFGVSLATVYELNPDLRTTPLRAGMEIVLPPPTR